MSFEEECAKLGEERDRKEREICLNCETFQHCYRGICESYRERRTAIMQEYKDKLAELKAKRKEQAAAKPRVRRKHKQQNQNL